MKRGLIETRGLFQINIFEESHINFPNVTITPIPTEQNNLRNSGHVSPFFKCNAIHSLTQRYFWESKTKFHYKVTEMPEDIA